MSPAISPAISDELIAEVTSRIAAGEPVRRSLPPAGRLYVERQVPFLCVLRQSVAGDDAGTDKLITGQAAYLLGSHDKSVQQSQAALVRAVVQTLIEVFGAFLLLELRAGSAEPVAATEVDPPLPRAHVTHFRDERGVHLADTLRKALARDKRLKDAWIVEASSTPVVSIKPPTILSSSEARALGCTRLVLELPPLYRDPDTGAIFPVVLRTVRRVVTIALRKVVFEFAKTRTTQKPRSFQTMGRRALVKVVWQVDSQLAEIARQYDFLLALTPTNLEQAWRVFRRTRFEQPPDFQYRPLTIDVSTAKRQLFSAPIEKIEDPTIADLFLEKQLELDRQLTLLADRGSRRVLFGSLQLYGAVDAALLREAETLIELIPPGTREPGDSKRVTAEQLATRASEEIERLRQSGLSVNGVSVHLRPDITGGLMVSRGRLLIAAGSTFPASRVEALIQHEVGTHVVTYLNGKSQRLQQLSVGLANYDETQEGLAVLAEYLVGGLSKPRMRMLAGRVVAAHVLAQGAEFVEAFRLLLRYGFSQRPAYIITSRAFRGGGLTKDAVYLRGLISVLDYLAAGEPLETLFVGKIARAHVGIVRELQARKILPSDPFLPRYLREDNAANRLSRARSGLRPFELLQSDR